MTELCALIFPSPSLPPDWSYSSGFVDGEMISSHPPGPGATSQILMCGPPPMVKFACLPNLEKLGYSEDMYIRPLGCARLSLG